CEIPRGFSRHPQRMLNQPTRMRRRDVAAAWSSAFANPPGACLAVRTPPAAFSFQSGPGPVSVDSSWSVLHLGQGRIPVGHLPRVQLEPLPVDLPLLLLVRREGEGLLLELDGLVEVPGLGVGGGQGGDADGLLPEGQLTSPGGAFDRSFAI